MKKSSSATSEQAAHLRPAEPGRALRELDASVHDLRGQESRRVRQAHGPLRRVGPREEAAEARVT